jgi:hypothetical protein
MEGEFNRSNGSWLCQIAGGGADLGGGSSLCSLKEVKGEGGLAALAGHQEKAALEALG